MARPSKTILGAAHQQLTQSWWEKHFEYDLLFSQSVWQECAAGNPGAIQRSMAALEHLDVLAVTEEIIALAEALIAQRLIPGKAIEDALHISIATLHHVSFLITWNCRHIANPLIQGGIAEYLEQRGLFLPIIWTPEELLGEQNDE